MRDKHGSSVLHEMTYHNLNKLGLLGTKLSNNAVKTVTFFKILALKMLLLSHGIMEVLN